MLECEIPIEGPKGFTTVIVTYSIQRSGYILWKSIDDSCHYNFTAKKTVVMKALMGNRRHFTTEGLLLMLFLHVSSAYKKASEQDNLWECLLMTDSSCSYFSLKLVDLIIQALEVIHYKAGNNRSCKILFFGRKRKSWSVTSISSKIICLQRFWSKYCAGWCILVSQ